MKGQSPRSRPPPSSAPSAEFVPEKINIGGNSRRGRRRGNTNNNESSPNKGRGGDGHTDSTNSQTSAISSSVVFHEENVELFDEIDELYPHDYEGGKIVSDPHASTSSVATSLLSDTNLGSSASLGASSVSTNNPIRRPRSDSNLSKSHSTLASSVLQSLQESAATHGMVNVPTDVDSLMASSTDGTLADIIAGMKGIYNSSTSASQASFTGGDMSPSHFNSSGAAATGSKRESIVGGKQISDMSFREQQELLAPERSDRSLVVEMKGDDNVALSENKNMLDSSEKSDKSSMCYYSPIIPPSDEHKESENVIVSSVDWSSLSKSCKRAQNAFRDVDSGQMVVKNMFLTHLGALTTVLTLYAKRYAKRTAAEGGNNASGNNGSDRDSLYLLDEIKARTRETKRALRFAISCMAPPRVQEDEAGAVDGPSSLSSAEKYRIARQYRQDLQEAAVKGFTSSSASSPTNNGDKESSSRHFYGLQIPLCEIIHANEDDGPMLSQPTLEGSEDINQFHREKSTVASIQKEKRMIRVLAARMLCNLVTDNPLAAEIVLKDIPFSPDMDQIEKRLSSLILGSRERAEQEGDKGTKKKDDNVLYWSDLIAATARAQPNSNNDKRDNREDDNSEDREALAATAASLHNLLTSLESRESLLELDDEMRRRELAKQEQQQKENGSRKANLSNIEIEVQHNTMKPIDVGFEVSSNGPLLNALLRNILPAKAVLMQSKLEKEQMDESMSSSRPQFKPPVSETENMSDSATEWISLVLERLASRGLLPNMLRSAAGSKTNVVTPEQVVLVSCIRQAVDDYHSALTPSGENGGFGRRRLSMDAKSAGMPVTTRPHPLWGRAEAGASSGARSAPSRDSRTAVPVLLTLANEAEEIRLRAKAIREGDCNEMYDGEESCIRRIIDDLVDILAQSLGRHAADNRTDKHCFVADARSVLGRETSFIASCCIDLARILDAALARNAGKKAREMRLSAQDQRTAIVMVRLVGNLVFQCQYNQDLLRITPVPMPDIAQNMSSSASSNLDNTQPTERMGLHVLLSATSLAPACFTLREWCIVAIRNAVEGNAANAETVRRLEANQALGDTPELQRMGVKVDMDERGNISVKRRDS